MRNQSREAKQAWLFKFSPKTNKQENLSLYEILKLFFSKTDAQYIFFTLWTISTAVYLM